MSDKPSPNATPTAPASPPPTGTIDVTDLVEKLKATWIRWATTTVVTTAKALPYLSWLAVPVVSTLFEFSVEKIVTVLANALEMQGFFIHTAIRKAGQAGDYINAIAAKAALPSTATNLEFENAEKAEMAAFRNFVMLTN